MPDRPPPPPGPYLVVGLARSGVAAALALRDSGEQVIGVDAGEPDGLGALERAGIELHLDTDASDLVNRAAALVKSPGVPRQAPMVAAALERGIPVLGELELAWRLLANEVIAVTGTNGKTTTVELIGHIHRQAGLSVAVAGNVGRALASLVGELPEETTVVCEASSFQLEDTLEFAPQAAVLLNITPDHLDRHTTMDAYRKAKLKLFAHQSSHDIAVVPAERSSWDPAGWASISARRVRFGVGEAELAERDGQLFWHDGAGARQAVIESGQLSLRGRHNLQNAMAAAAVCLARGLDIDAVREGLATFPGVPHRLEEVATHDGVMYVNDSKATNLASTLVALESFDTDPARPVHLILGGQAKGQDFAPLREPISGSCRAVYVIGQDAPVIVDALAGLQLPVWRCGELERALAKARAAARPGEVVLLSPACASFDQFNDFEARGERFRELVDALG